MNNIKNENDKANTDVNNTMANVNGFHKKGAAESISERLYNPTVTFDNTITFYWNCTRLNI